MCGFILTLGSLLQPDVRRNLGIPAALRQGPRTLPRTFPEYVNGSSGPRHAKHSPEDTGGALPVPTRGKVTVLVSPDNDCSAGHGLWVVMVMPDARETENAAMPLGGQPETQGLARLHRHRKALGAGGKQLGFP